MWQAKCPERASKNKDFLPMENLASSEINIDESKISATYEEARKKALKLSGTAGNAAMANMRKKTRTWYEASLRKLLTYFCVETSSTEELERCVPQGSPFASTDVSNKCVKLTDSDNCNDQGLCERDSNCKWDDAFDKASSRREFFTVDDVYIAMKWVERDYPSSFLPLITPGTVIAVLVSLTCIGFVILRCIFNQCGGRNPSEKGYSRCDIFVPAAIFIVSTVAVFICAVVTVAENTNISHGVNGVLHSINVTLENIDIHTYNLMIPLQEANTMLQGVSVNVREQLKDAAWVEKDAKTLQGMISDYKSIYGSQGPFPFKDCEASSQGCIPCPEAVCGSVISDFVQTASLTLKSDSQAAAGAVKSMNDSFANKVIDIQSAIRKANLLISGVNNMTKSSKETVSEIKQTFDNYSFSRGALVMSVFVFGVFACVVGSIGIFKGICDKKSPLVHLLHLCWMLGVLVAILGFVLSSSLLAVGGVWYDSCNYMNIVREDLSPYFPQTISSVINSCFNDSSLLEPLKLDDPLAFSCELDVSYDLLKAGNFESQIDAITNFGSFVSDLSLHNFKFDPALSRELLAKSTEAAGLIGPLDDEFSRDTIKTPWILLKKDKSVSDCASISDQEKYPICFMNYMCDSVAGNGDRNACRSSFKDAYTYTLAFSKIGQMLDEMREDLLGDTGKGFSAGWKYDVSLMEFAQKYYKRLRALKESKLDALMAGDMGRVMESVERIRCTQNCGWINMSFNALNESLCSDVLGTTLAISLCVLFLSLFLLPMIVTAITLQKRLRGSKKGTYEQLEKRLQALEQKTSKEDGRSTPNVSKKIELFKMKRNLV
jgi:hypothetical protein